MGKTALDIYDDMPVYMRRYVSNYGWHFNKAAYMYATKDFKNPYTKEQFTNMLSSHGMTINNDVMYDPIFLASLAKEKLYGSSLKDEKSIILFVHDIFKDDDTVFRKWVATMVGKGNPVDWEELC